MKVHVFSPVYINKSDAASREEELNILESFLKEISLQIRSKNIDNFTLFDDGCDKETKSFLASAKKQFPWINIIASKANAGLYTTLEKAYALMSHNPDDEIIVRLDSDGEHDPGMIAQLIKKISEGFDGALCQIKYIKEHQDDFDIFFNPSAGNLQGNIIFGRPLLHNSPGFSAYRVKVVKAVLESLAAYREAFKKRFNEDCKGINDITFMFLAVKAGFSIDTENFHDSRLLPMNRGPEKVLAQSLSNAKDLIVMQEFSLNS
jgi:glycosyltransferase involved in cell wall biosynthesis